MILKSTPLLTSLLITGCIGKEIKQVDVEQSAEMLTCIGFCYQVELGAAAEAMAEEDIRDLEDTLEDIKMIEEATQEEMQQNTELAEEVAAEVNKIRALDKKKYEGTELEDVVR